jgi:hypothetical protein
VASIVTQKQVTAHVSPARKCWRLVYNASSKRVFILYEAEGHTMTMQTMFCSSPTDGGPGSLSSPEGRKECLEQIRKLGLVYSPPPAEMVKAEIGP